MSDKAARMVEAALGRQAVQDGPGAVVADDAGLVALAKQDRRAFAALFDRYLDRVYRYCLLRLDDRDAAEDAASLVFTKALDGLAGCRDSSFRPWLFAIARNVVTDAHRSRRVNEPLESATGLPDPAPALDERAAAGDEIARVHAAIARLSPEQRDVVELRMAGLTGPEIARALGRSHGAVRIAQFRAYERLRVFLEPPGASGETIHER